MTIMSTFVVLERRPGMKDDKTLYEDDSGLSFQDNKTSAGLTSRLQSPRLQESSKSLQESFLKKWSLNYHVLETRRA